MSYQKTYLYYVGYNREYEGYEYSITGDHRVTLMNLSNIRDQPEENVILKIMIDNFFEAHVDQKDIFDVSKYYKELGQDQNRLTRWEISEKMCSNSSNSSVISIYTSKQIPNGHRYIFIR